MDSISTQQAIHIALSHHKEGRLAEAESVYRHVLSQEPAHARALNLLGVILIQTGRAVLAIDLLTRAIALDPTVADYHSNLGESFRHSGRLDEAIGSYSRAIALKPGLAVAHNNLGIALAALGKIDEAIAAFESAVRLTPSYAEAHNNLGNALKDAGRADEAIRACRSALQLKPHWAQAHVSLGAALAHGGRHADAVEAYRSAIALDPERSAAHSNLGNALAAVGRSEEALAACELAVTLEPGSVQAHWNYAVMLLRAGDYQRGWDEYEWRWQVPSMLAKPRFTMPMWDGTRLNGKTILLHAEQGLGDTVQFVRYASTVAEHGGRVVLESPAELCRLFKTCPGISQIISQGESLPAFDEHAPLMSLPRILDTRIDTIPEKIPYLHAQIEAIARWKTIVRDSSGRLNVGLACAGSPLHSNDRGRSIPIKALAPLAKLPVRYHGVQNNEAGRSRISNGSVIPISDHTDALPDFSETAALLANLDLLITVDTAVAHLGGAMGLETWLLLPFLADWRWLSGRDNTPWYPSMKLFRQKEMGRWETVISECTAELGQRISRA